MKVTQLQINTNGGWRSVATFEPTPANLTAVKEATAAFARSIAAIRDDDYGKPPSWRLTKDGRSAAAYCDAPNYVWRKA